MPIRPAGRNLARRIIELSDKIAEHSKQLSEDGFTPTAEFVEETRRLTEMCRQLMEEADEAHAQRDMQ